MRSRLKHTASALLWAMTLLAVHAAASDDYKDSNRDDFDYLLAFETYDDASQADLELSWVWFGPTGIQAINRDGRTENVAGIKTPTSSTTSQVDERLDQLTKNSGTGNIFHNVDKIAGGRYCSNYYAAPSDLF